METWREELYHYAKGETAKNHKYIRKEGNRYIYEESKKSSSNAIKTASGYKTGGSTVSGSGFGGVDDGGTGRQYSVSFVKQLSDDDKQRINSYIAKKLINGATLEGAEAAKQVRDMAVEMLAKMERNEPWTKEEMENISSAFDIAAASELNPATIVKELYDLTPKYKNSGIYDSHFGNELYSYASQLIQNLTAFMSKIKHSDTYTKELYHTAIGGTLIITRR